MSRAQREFYLADESAMLLLAAACAEHWHNGALVYLEGELGAGKTTFSRGVLRALGYAGPVKSPTYTLVEPYRLATGLQVYHCDLYRVADPEELEYLGLREMLSPHCLCLIEWPERGRRWLPEADLRIVIRPEGDGRRVLLYALSDRADAMLALLRN